MYSGSRFWGCFGLAALAASYPVAVQAMDSVTTLSVTATVVESCRATTAPATGSAASAGADAALTSTNLSVVCNHEADWASSAEILQGRTSHEAGEAASTGTTDAAEQRDRSSASPKQAGAGDRLVVTISY